MADGGDGGAGFGREGSVREVQRLYLFEEGLCW